MSHSWVETGSGREVSLLNPRPEDICIEDIAQALSRQCRYNGHCERFYSVAQHSLLVSEYLDLLGFSPMTQLCGLMHDAAEAYIGDLVSPVKDLPGIKEAFGELERRFELVIAERFGLDWGGNRRMLVHHADRKLCITEASQMLQSRGRNWGFTTRPWDIEIAHMPNPGLSFTAHFHTLMGEINSDVDTREDRAQ